MCYLMTSCQIYSSIINRWNQQKMCSILGKISQQNKIEVIMVLVRWGIGSYPSHGFDNSEASGGGAETIKSWDTLWSHIKICTSLQNPVEGTLTPNRFLLLGSHFTSYLHAHVTWLCYFFKKNYNKIMK